MRWANAGAEGEIPAAAGRRTWWRRYALSEAGSGSDAFAMATRAEDHGDHFLLTGRKLWITNAAEAGLLPAVRQCQSGGRISRASRRS